MSSQYSDKTIEVLKKRFVATTAINGRLVILDASNLNVEVNYLILLSSAGQIETEYLHSSWGDDYQRLLGELRGKLSQVIRFEYLPSKGPLVPISGGYHNQFIMNTYKEPDMKPTNEYLEPKPFLEFMGRQFPVLEEMKMVIALMAMNVRRPARKIRQALLIRGEQGTGKGVLMDMIWGRLVGCNYFKCKLRNVTAKFNGFLATHTTICIDELYNNQKANANNLKTIITDTRFPVEVKGQDITSPINYCFIIATSNDWSPIYIEEQDRRWFVPKFSKHHKSKEETQEFISKRFVPWLEGDGLQAIRNYLETIDLNNFNFDIAMDTQSKRELIHVDPREESMEELNHFLMDGCYHGVRLKALQDSFKGLGENEIILVLKKCNYQRDANAKKYVEAKRYRWWTNNLHINSGRYLVESDEFNKVPLTYINNNTLEESVSDVPSLQSLERAGYPVDTQALYSCVSSVQGVSNA
jgi:hypothetical protein